MHLLDALNNSLPEVFRAIDLMGVLLNGILGGKVARERNFDAVGFCILAIMTALAGGMIRDLLLTTRAGAPVAITDPYYLWFAIVGALIAMAFRMDSRAWSVLLVIADGMVLGCWSATGAIKTLDAGFAIMPAILLGIMTAIGGGMVRDISAGLVPRVFGGNNLYATPAFACSLVTVIFWHMGQPVLGMGHCAGQGSHLFFLAGHADGHAHGEQQRQIVEHGAAGLAHHVQNGVDQGTGVDDAGAAVVLAR